MPYISEWEEKQTFDRCKIARKCYLAGIYAASWPEEVGGTPFEGKAHDKFHNLIAQDEFARCGAGGVEMSIMVGVSIGVGPLVHYGSKKVKEEILRPVLEAKKFICLAVTEPTAGSDVAGIRTTAVLDKTGRFYIVNGSKKFITGGGAMLFLLHIFFIFYFLFIFLRICRLLYNCS